ncbi:TonB-dependent receptor plug domain-containing protein [Flavobacterium selenitireducens]|uniref:TonB-dependent receptor plug domain-containing protein n=1 Tax=Flavobacterium selenitireducens TaxID=2722704 RepID=UPI00168A8091|nr:TonB-dependent receptor plug domain-containing protein [Flavobacterium selenitireducens]MBD3583479.1 TonB-dependent receptor plug domain-containing protein [Flavobacterium selenitireducens]
MLAKTLLPAAFLLFGLSAFAQNDTIVSGEKLKEVVVTGQYNPQSVKKSVYQVEVISREVIDRQAGNNLADLLNQTLNITVMPSSSTGKSTVEMFGLDSKYIKILVDNVPVINDEGLGNFTDLTQINLDDIQQIEIVRGSMGVEYGANAVAGIINIITKKSSKYKWEVTPFLQEETIGNEYDGITKGRHIRSIRIGHNISPNWYAYGMFTANDFDGFLNHKKGRDYIQNDSLRGYEWLPKSQLHAKAHLGFTPNHSHRFFYRFEFFNEKTKFFNDVVDLNYDPATETNDPIANDKMYKSRRFVHLLNGSGRFESGLTYDVYASYQQQERDLVDFQYRIRSGEKFNLTDQTYESRKAWFTKGTLSNFLDSETVDFQVGYEVNEIHGYASTFTGMLPHPIERTLGSYDVFGSTEINVTSKFSLRPGARALFSSKFDPMAALSLSAKYSLGGGYDLRGVFGTCPRLPTYEELYTFFVDANHNVTGNPNLTPENGVSAFLHLGKVYRSGSKLAFDTKFSAWYLNVRDRIELISFVDDGLSWQYGNIDLYRTYGSSLTSQIHYGNFGFNAGFTFSGVSKVINSSTGPSNDDYLHSVQANGNAFYRIPKWSTTLSTFLKYNGPEYQFITTGDLTEEGGTIFRGKRDGFTSLDATVTKSFDKERLQVTLGARNLTDVTRVNTTAVQGGTHDGAASSQLLGYGRSYFLKILYKFNFG